MLLNTEVISEDQPKISSPFKSFQHPTETSDFPYVSIVLTRESDHQIVTLEIFKDRVLTTWKKKYALIIFEHEICFGFNIQKGLVWFKNTEYQSTQVFSTSNHNQLILFVNQLRSKCAQQNFNESYQLLEKKGKGKNSCVYEAKNKLDNKIYAVKIQSYSSSIKQQLSILKQLDHPNIIYFRQYFIQSDNKIYILMDYENGGSLLDLLKLKQKISEKDIIKIFTDMLNALEYLRIKGVVHKDLKPENILYSKKDGKYKIADFGLSKKQGQRLDKISGTPGYIAPELFANKTSCFADIKSDIYSMGLIFYEILTLQQFYDGQTSQQILKNNLKKTSLKKRKTGFQIPSIYLQLLEKMIRSDPKKRKTSIQILQSSVFRKINKLHGIEILSSTSPSKKVDSENEQNQKDDGLVDSFWKLLRIRSWSG